MDQSETAQLLSVSIKTVYLYSLENPPIPLLRRSQTEVEYEASAVVRWFAAHEVVKALRAHARKAERSAVRARLRAMSGGAAPTLAQAQPESEPAPKPSPIPTKPKRKSPTPRLKPGGPVMHVKPAKPP